MSFEEPVSAAGWCARWAEMDAALDEQDGTLAEIKAALAETDALLVKEGALLDDLDRRLCAVESALFPRPKNEHRAIERKEASRL